jgi:hypothetical protein
MTEVRLSLISATETYELWQGPIAPGSDWESDLALCRRVHTSLPQELAAGDYTLAVNGPLLNAAEPITLGSIAVGPSTRLYELPKLARTLHITFTGEEEGEIALVGLSAEPEVDAETNQLSVDLVWQPSARINANYNAFVHLLDSAGTIVAQSDATPGGDKITTLPPEVASKDELGSYQLVAGLYDPIGMQRLLARTPSAEELPDGRAPLGSLSVPSP